MISNDKQKILLKFTSNFLKMLSEEDCENIKVKFWIGLEDQIKNLGIENEDVVKIIFEEILNKNFEIVNNKNLLFCMINFLREKSQKTFDNYFLNLIYKYLQNFEDNQSLFTEFFLELIFNMYIIVPGDDHKFYLDFTEEIIEKIKKFFYSFIDFDIDLFILVLKNNFEVELDYFSTLFNNKEYSDIFNYFMEKLIKDKYAENLIYFFEKIEEYLFTDSHKFEKIKNQKGLSNILKQMENICTVFLTHKKQNDDEEELDDIDIQNHNLILVKILKIIHKLIETVNKYLPSNGQINEKVLEKFLIHIIEQIINSNKLFFSNIKIFIKFYNLPNLNLAKFKSLFILTLYSFIDEIYDTNNLKLYESSLNTIISDKNESCLNIILSEIISKVVQMNQQNRYLDKSKFNIERKFEIAYNICLEYSDESNVEYKNLYNYYHISNYSLINFVVNDIFTFNKSASTDNKRVLNFNQYNFINIMNIISSLRIENYDSEFQNFMLKLMLRILTFLYSDIYLKSGHNLNPVLFEKVFFNLNKISDKQFLKTEIYPLVLTFIQGVIFPNYLYFSTNLSVVHMFFNFLFEFYRHDNITNLTCKLLMSLFNLKVESVEIQKSNKIFALNKFAELVEKLKSTKFFTLFFNFCIENLKKEESSSFIYNSLYIFCCKYEGALQNSLLEFVFAKFEKCFENLPENCNLETLFAVSSVYEILIKDQPEKIVNKIYESFYNKKLLRIMDKFFKELSQKESTWIPNFFEDNKDIKFEHINKNLEKLNFTNLVMNNKCDSQNISFSILLHISKIFSLFVSNIIINNKEKFDVKTLSDQNNKTITSLLQTFDYIVNGILFSDGSKSHSQLIFLNEFFGHFDNLNFFYNTHSYYMSINHIEKQNLDFSQLKEINTLINRDKNKEFIYFMKMNENSIFFMKNLLNNIMNYEGNIIYLYESKKYNAMNTKTFVIDSLYDNQTLNNITKNSALTELTEKKNMGEFFVKALFESLYSTELDEATLKMNENIYMYLLYHNTFVKFFKNIHDLLNLDIILINFYNIIKKYKYPELIANFLNFIIYFAKINKNVLQFSIRLLSNKKIFNNTLMVDRKISHELFNLINYIFYQILFYNSYKSENINLIQTIFDNVEGSIFQNDAEQSHIINLTNLTYYGKIIIELYSAIKLHAEDNSHRQIEINKKFKENLLNLLTEDIVVRYMNNLIIQPFTDKSEANPNIKIIENNMLAYFENLDLLTQIKNSKNITEKNVNRVTKDVTNPLLENILLMQEISFPKALYHLLNNYCTLLKNKKVSFNKIYIDIIENYILYQVTHKSYEKLCIEITKNILFNKEFYQVNWEGKYKLVSMLLLTLLRDNSSTTIKGNFFDSCNNEIMKNLGSFLNFNILKK